MYKLLKNDLGKKIFSGSRVEIEAIIVVEQDFSTALRKYVAFSFAIMDILVLSKKSKIDLKSK